ALLSLYVIFDLHPVLLALASGQPTFTGVAHAGHLGGLAFGFLYYKSGVRLETPFERVPKLPARKRRRAEVEAPREATRRPVPPPSGAAARRAERPGGRDPQEDRGAREGKPARAGEGGVDPGERGIPQGPVRWRRVNAPPRRAASGRLCSRWRRPPRPTASRR